MCCGIPGVCGGFNCWSLWGPRDNTEWVDVNWFNHAEFTWKDECWEEFKVDISHELVGMDEKSMGVTVSILIPQGRFGVSSMGKGSDLLTGVSQSSWYLVMLTPWLSCQEISESLQSQGSGHLYYCRDGISLE